MCQTFCQNIDSVLKPKRLLAAVLYENVYVPSWTTEESL